MNKWREGHILTKHSILFSNPHYVFQVFKHVLDRGYIEPPISAYKIDRLWVDPSQTHLKRVFSKQVN